MRQYDHSTYPLNQLFVVLDRDLGIRLNVGRRHNVQMYHAFFDVVQYFSVGPAGPPHKPRIIAVGPRIDTKLHPPVCQLVQKQERSSVLVIAQLAVGRHVEQRLKLFVLRRKHVLPSYLNDRRLWFNVPRADEDFSSGMRHSGTSLHQVSHRSRRY